MNGGWVAAPRLDPAKYAKFNLTEQEQGLNPWKGEGSDIGTAVNNMRQTQLDTQQAWWLQNIYSFLMLGGS